MKNLKKMLALMLSLQILTVSISIGAENEPTEKLDLSLQEIMLPSEVKDMGKQPGSIYYNTSVKNKVLIPAHFWGEVVRPGLHFVPTDTNLIKGLSMAGGPTSSAKIEDIILTRNMSNGKVEQFEFDLSKGGNEEANKFKLISGDSIFIKKDQFREDRAYYTSLAGIAVSIISTFILLSKVK